MTCWQEPAEASQVRGLAEEREEGFGGVLIEGEWAADEGHEARRRRGLDKCVGGCDRRAIERLGRHQAERRSGLA